MALYRTERRLNWHYRLRIGHWYAPWSRAQTDTGADYFSRMLHWLRNSYPKADIIAGSQALPDINESWPQGHFGLLSDAKNAQSDHSAPATDPSAPIAASPDSDALTNETTSHVLANETTSHASVPHALPSHAGDLLLVEWPQAAADPLPPLWINGLERALRRNWQDNPLAEVIFIGGTAEICEQGLALASHYGITVLDPAARLRPESPDAPDHREALIRAGKTSPLPALTPQGQEIWAGMLIGLLREQVRYGPTPDPVSLPSGLWCR